MDRSLLTCPICKGMGFSEPGVLCSCITGQKKDGETDNMQAIKDLFGDIFKDK
jgi:hypothetical protein